jgi:parallel beta-helix repeat protein
MVWPAVVALSEALDNAFSTLRPSRLLGAIFLILLVYTSPVRASASGANSDPLGYLSRSPTQSPCGYGRPAVLPSVWLTPSWAGPQVTKLPTRAGDFTDFWDYIISTDANQVKAENIATGHIDFSSTDARIVIQSAINTLKQGGKILLKEGTYSLTKNPTWSSGAIVISDATKITLEGQGNGTVLRVGNGENTDAILVQRNSYGIAIRNMQIDGNKAQQTARQDGHGVELDGGAAGDILSDVVIEGLYVHDTYGTGIWIQRSSNITVQNNLIVANRGMDKDSQGIKLYTVSHVVLKGNRVRNVNYRCIGISQGSYDILVQDNNLDSCEFGIEVSGSDVGPSHDITITGNQIHNVNGAGGDALRIENGSYNIKVTSNSIDNAARFGVFIVNGHDVTITSNTIRFTGDYAIYARAGYNITVGSNTMTNVHGTVHLP